MALALGDVSGKGMPASLMMMALHARVQVLAEDPGNLAAFMTRLNKATCANCPSNRFITFFFCVLDPSTGELTFANAGPQSAHPGARVGRGARCWKAAVRCWAFCPIAPYSEMRARLDTGDMLVLYSDGVTEANNRESRRIRRGALHRGVASSTAQKPAAEIVEAVTRSLAEFAAGAPQADDITLVVAKRV